MISPPTAEVVGSVSAGAEPQRRTWTIERTTSSRGSLSASARTLAAVGRRLKWLRRLASIGVILLLWYLGSTHGWIEPQKFPSPGDVWQAFTDLLEGGELASHLLASLGRIGKGLLLGGRSGSWSARSPACRGSVRRSSTPPPGPPGGAEPGPHVALHHLVRYRRDVEGWPHRLGRLLPPLPQHLRRHPHRGPRLVEGARIFGLGRFALATKVMLPGALPRSSSASASPSASPGSPRRRGASECPQRRRLAHHRRPGVHAHRHRRRGPAPVCLPGPAPRRARASAGKPTLAWRAPTRAGDAPLPAVPQVAADQRVHVALVDGIRREFRGRVVLDDVSLRIGAGEFVALLGASAGTTTILRAVAGGPAVTARIGPETSLSSPGARRCRRSTGRNGRSAAQAGAASTPTRLGRRQARRPGDRLAGDALGRRSPRAAVAQALVASPTAPLDGRSRRSMRSPACRAGARRPLWPARSRPWDPRRHRALRSPIGAGRTAARHESVDLPDPEPRPSHLRPTPARARPLGVGRGTPADRSTDPRPAHRPTHPRPAHDIQQGVISPPRRTRPRRQRARSSAWRLPPSCSSPRAGVTTTEAMPPRPPPPPPARTASPRLATTRRPPSSPSRSASLHQHGQSAWHSRGLCQPDRSPVTACPARVTKTDLRLAIGPEVSQAIAGGSLDIASYVDRRPSTAAPAAPTRASPSTWTSRPALHAQGASPPSRSSTDDRRRTARSAALVLASSSRGAPDSVRHDTRSRYVPRSRRRVVAWSRGHSPPSTHAGSPLGRPPRPPSLTTDALKEHPLPGPGAGPEVLARRDPQAYYVFQPPILSPSPSCHRRGRAENYSPSPSPRPAWRCSSTKPSCRDRAAKSLPAVEGSFPLRTQPSSTRTSRQRSVKLDHPTNHNPRTAHNLASTPMSSSSAAVPPAPGPRSAPPKPGPGRPRRQGLLRCERRDRAVGTGVWYVPPDRRRARDRRWTAARRSAATSPTAAGCAGCSTRRGPGCPSSTECGYPFPVDADDGQPGARPAGPRLHAPCAAVRPGRRAHPRPQPGARAARRRRRRRRRAPPASTARPAGPTRSAPARS